MATVADHAANSRLRLVRPLVWIGARAAGSALRPVTGTAVAAVGVGINAERRVVERVLDRGELELVVTTALDYARVQAAFRRALDSDVARQLVDGLFDNGLIDYFIERLTGSDALSRLVDEIAQSPSVRAALSQQGVGFGDQIGGAVRSRRADRRIDRAAGRLRQHSHHEGPADPDVRGQ